MAKKKLDTNVMKKVSGGQYVIFDTDLRRPECDGILFASIEEAQGALNELPRAAQCIIINWDNLRNELEPYFRNDNAHLQWLLDTWQFPNDNNNYY